MSEAETAYKAALAEIARVQRAGWTELRFEGEAFRALDRIPPQVAELEGLETLSLSQTAVTDLAPLAGLDALQWLSLSQTAVTDLAPLAGLAALQNLYLIQSAVTDLTPLAGLAALRWLDLSQTAVTDLTPLAGLAALQRLDLSQTAVTDLAPLAGLAALQYLHLDQTAVTDLAPLAGLAALQGLSLSQTAATDLAPLAGLAELQTLSLSQTAVTNLAPLAGLAALQVLYLTQTAVTDLAPLAGLAALQTLDLAQTAVTDLAPLAGLAALTDLSSTGSQVADLRPIRRLSKLGTNGRPGLSFTNTPASRADAELAQLAGITDTETRARETLAYLNTLPPWPQPYTPKSHPDGNPPKPIGQVKEPPAVRTAETQIRGLLRNALVTRVSAAVFAAQISAALQDVPTTHGNERTPVLQIMAEVGEVLDLIARQEADKANEEALLRLRIAHLESLVDHLTIELQDAEKAREAAEEMAKKDGFMASYRKSLATAAGVGTIGLIGVGVPTAAIYFLGAEHPLVQAFLTAIGRLPKN